MNRFSARVHARTVALSACWTIGLASPSARASDPRDESRTAFLRGVSEAHQEHFTAARDAFIEAYRLFPHPSILMNLGIARMRTGEYIASEENLSRFLKDDGGAPPEDIANARAALVVVRGHIGTLRVRVSPPSAKATLDGAPLALMASTFTDVRAVTGPATLRVSADGYLPDTREVLVLHEQVQPVDFILVPGSASSRESPRGEPSGDARHALLGWGLVGTAGVLAVVGTIAGVEAINFAHDYNTAGAAGFQDPSTRSTGIGWRTSADVLFTGAIIAGGVGAYVLLRPLKAAPDVHVSASPSFVGVTGRF